MFGVHSQSLFCLSIFGQVLEIITLRRDGLRGQAWVIFEDVQTATDALQKEQGFTLFGKDLKIAYANEKSDRIAKRDGSYIPKAKRRKRKQDAADAAAAAAAAATAPSADGSSAPSTDGAPDGPPPPPQKPAQQPSHILFATDLPSECNEMMLAMLFRQVRAFRWICNFDIFYLVALLLTHINFWYVFSFLDMYSTLDTRKFVSLEPAWHSLNSITNHMLP
jgi:hypothetical protein